MLSLWNDREAPEGADVLSMRVYSSRLIGLDRSLVLHGGGNTSAKGLIVDRFGQNRSAMWIKASGFDLGTMGEEGFTALDLERVRRLGELDILSDADMVKELKIARFDPDAAAASIEAIVHALIPFTFVDHSHADAVLTISNTPDGTRRLDEIYGPSVRILPYVKPGFDLALQIRALIRRGELSNCDALILEHHGVFTFSNDARASYEKMIEVVGKAADYLAANVTPPPLGEAGLTAMETARARHCASHLAGRALIALSGPSVAEDMVDRLADLARNGTVTPEHVIHNKPFPAVLDRSTPSDGLNAFAEDYRAYFMRAGDPNLQMLSPFPHWAFSKDGATLAFGPNLKRATISADVVRVTLEALLQADQMGGWQGLPEHDLRALEYWELEQAKLKRQPADPVLAGKIAVVAGSATGIGLATAKMLNAKGAAVIGLDIDPAVSTTFSADGFEGFVVDLRDEKSVANALDRVVRTYGGLDILVCNAGIFRTGSKIEELDDTTWDLTLDINLTAHRKLLKCAIPYLKLGIDPSVVFVASRNVTAPGAGAAAYSVSKAGLTQLMRVAALEYSGDGIAFNAVHPDAVFDTRLWTPDALEASAKRYGMDVEKYKKRNLLHRDIRSTDVATAIIAFVDGTLRCTTGCQLPVDGGNERVI